MREGSRSGGAPNGASGASAPGRSGPSARPASLFLPSKNFRPTGSLAYLQTKSPYLYAPSFQVPLPRVPLAPKFCTYSFSRDKVCGKPSSLDAAAATQSSEKAPPPRNAAAPSAPAEEELEDDAGASVFDVAASLQLLQEFDVAGLLPNLINPKGYPNLLAVPPPPVSGARTPGSRPISTRPAAAFAFQHLPPEDLALVANVLPELKSQRALLAKREIRKADGEGEAEDGRGAAAKSSGDEFGKSEERSGGLKDEAGEGRADAAFGVYRHPRHPHLRPRRIFSVVPHRRLCGNDYLPVGIDLPAAELEALEAAGASTEMPPALLLVNETTRTSVSYAYYTRAAEAASRSPSAPKGEEGREGDAGGVKREESEHDKGDAWPQTKGGDGGAPLQAKYRFARDYSCPMLSKKSPTATEHSFLLILPNATADAEASVESFAYVVPLHSQRRILVKAGGNVRRPRLTVVARPPTQEEEEGREARRAAACGRGRGRKRGREFSGEEDASDSEELEGDEELAGETEPEEAAEGDAAEGPESRKRRRKGAAAEEGDGGAGADGLFDDEEEEEKEESASSSSSDSSSSEDEGEEEEEEDSSESSNEEE
ncbi:RNA polymerase II associated Paf1 complex component PAF1 [Besnoitia besnoiti]|uniref:RNA polymerase II associated Paf1 complex component PAF1 n=1 Tax=Besnoitia besnoiti TaxID=94643 RepID=A0A2A9MJA8_BESBE|nr:RNA polymerase II associated Paf1 complex component PAF1 [Besnoitia besnoiti]PFH38055.1 RNA polymerase II associated Paf1 complex component PAF1 [Besnoitia besnoiti]